MRGLLLNRRETGEAEQWLSEWNAGTEPGPTDSQRNLISESRRATGRRQRIIIGATSAALVVSLAATVVAVLQRNEANRQKQHAQVQALVSASQAHAKDDPALSARLAVAAYRRDPSSEVEGWVRKTLAAVQDKTLWRASDAIWGAQFSPDGRRVATAALDGKITVWRTRDASVIAAMGSSAGNARSVSFSPDGRQVLSGDDNGLAYVWDARTGERIRTVDTGPAAVNAVAFSADGDLAAAAGADGHVSIWSARNGTSLGTISTGSGGINSVSFSPDSRELLTAGDDGTARVWTRTGRQLANVRASRRRFGSEFPAYSAGFSPDGKRIVTAGEDHVIRIWLWRQERVVSRIARDIGGVRTVKFDPTGRRIVTAGDDHVVRVWDTSTLHQEMALRGHTGIVRAADFGSDGGTVLSAGDDGTARVWSLQRHPDLVRAFPRQRGGVTSVSFSPDGHQLLTTAAAERSGIWDLQTGMRLERLAEPALRGSFSPDGREVATVNGNIATVWSTISGQPISSFSNEGFASSIDFDPTGDLVVTGSTDGSAYVWSAGTGEERTTITPGDSPILDAEFSPDGDQIATAGVDRTVRISSAADGARVATLKGHRNGVWTAEFDEEGTQVLSASADGSAILWDAASARVLTTLDGRSSDILAASFNPDGERVLTAGFDGAVRVWQGDTGQELESFLGSGSIEDAAFSPNGQLIAFGDENGYAKVVKCGSPCEPTSTLLSDASRRVGTLSASELAVALGD